MDLTVMSFNLRYNTPNDGENIWENRVNCAAQIIKDHHPLIVGTQEGYHVMLTDLQERLEAYAWVGQGRMGEHENEHCAVFYRKDRLEVLEQGQFWLSETPEVPASKSWDSMLPRICTWVQFRVRESGNCFLVYNTHLDHYGPQARAFGAQLIWEQIEAHRKELELPVILMGDMNSHPGDDAIRLFRGEQPDAQGRRSWLIDGYSSLLAGPIGLTAHSFKGGAEGQPIDYIFVSPETEVRGIQVDRRMIDGRYPSDHYPIVAQLHMGGNGRRA